MGETAKKRKVGLDKPSQERQDIHLCDPMLLSEIVSLCNSLNIAMSENGNGLLILRPRHPAADTHTHTQTHTHTHIHLHSQSLAFRCVFLSFSSFFFTCLPFHFSSSFRFFCIVT